MADSPGTDGLLEARQRAYGVPLLAGGLLLAGAAALYAGLTDWNGWDGGVRLVGSGPHAGVWTGLAPWSPTVFFPPPTSWFMMRERLFGPSAFYLGWYWAVGLAALLFTTAWYRGLGRQPGRRMPGRAFLMAGGALVVLAVALPALTQAVPRLSLLWLAQPWLKGFPALLITAAAVGVLAWVERSRRLARLAGAYAGVTLLTCAALLRPGVPIIGWPSAFGGLTYATPMVILMLPAAVLIVAGLVALNRDRLGGGGVRPLSRRGRLPRWRGRWPGRGRLPA